MSNHRQPASTQALPRSGAAATDPEEPTSAVAPPSLSWRQRWLEAVVVVTVVTALVAALVTALTMVLMGELNSIEGEIRASETRTREEIRASEARQNKRSDALKVDIKAINDLLLETLLADQSRDAQRASIAWPTPGGGSPKRAGDEA